ncbi:MAG TPA: M28 family peptidase [Gemmatimonadaceae bacterium]|nr:M28 family peptidase [Gemmatimonadaceae bacterium]
MTIRTLVSAAVALSLLSAGSGAQTFPTNDPVLKKIWDIGMNQSKAQEMGQVMFDSIGPRLVGSPGIKSASDWVIKTYKSWGIDAKTEQYGTWRGWDRGYTHIDLVKPRVRTLEGLMTAWSPGTGGKDVVGDAILLPMVHDSTEFLKWLPNVKGKYVLMSAPRMSCRPNAEWEEFATPAEIARRDSINNAMTAAFNNRQNSSGLGGGRGRGANAGGPPPLTMNERLDRAGAAGLIAMGGGDAWGTYVVGAQARTTHAVMLTMSCEDYTLVYRLAEKNQGPVVRVNAESKALGMVPAFNTIATVKGGAKADEYVMFSAHFDSWDAGSGATDNGTGTLVMMEAMRILKLAYPNPNRTFIAGHWSGEEQGLNGSRAFTADHPEVLAKLQALFNQDNGTGRIQSTSGVGMINGAAHLQQWLAKLPRELQEQVRFSGIGGPATGGTDNASFDCYGTPAFGLSSISWDYNPYTHHTNRDTYDKVVWDQVKGNATIAAMLAYLASEDPSFITRERRNLNEPDPLAPVGGGRGGGGRGGRGGRGAANDDVAGKVTRSGDSVTVTFTFPVNASRGDSAGGGRGGRGAAGRGGGGGGGGADVDALGWAKTCNKGARTDGGH